MSTELIKTLFASNITRRIEEVIKVDQTDEEVIADEIKEYVVTDAIQSHFTNVFEQYRETPNKPHEGIAVWISGFFGSGKSSFAKVLGLSISNRNIQGESAANRFVQQTNDKKLHVLLKTITEQIPTHAVIFDVSTDRGIRSGNQSLTEIMYGLLLQSLGYAKDLDLSELEITLEETQGLVEFEKEYKKLFAKEWNQEKGKIAFALSEASRVLHSLDSDTYPMADSWVKAIKNRADITPGKLAERCGELIRRRKPGHHVMFVIDEVGQFVARDVQKMLDLQAIVQSLGVKGRGKHWIVVTSQEKLGELVSGLDDKRIELARLMDRFPIQVHLEPSDISVVTSRRVLSKNASAQELLGKLYDKHRGRLTESTRLTADIKLPELTHESFIDLYPLLPYQVDLIIQVVSGLRTQGGASKHVGGANRTIIKLAQQVLINPAVNLADKPLGTLVRLDHVYDLVEGNIGSDIRAKIAAIAREIDHPLSQQVAKVICLLQYVKSVHRTPENIAAALHPSLDADSQLPAVKEALRLLEKAHKVRQGDDGYRIPTPAEDDWERIRMGISPGTGDPNRLYAEILTSFWQPQPSYTLFDSKTFKSGLAIHGREEVTGDIIFNLFLAEDGKNYQELIADLRARSQQERKSVFWAVALSSGIDREMVELFRSKQMLSRKEREARTADETALIGEEKLRLRRHQDELRRLLKTACLSGTVYFRGNDRSPADPSADTNKSTVDILGAVLPDVFDRFKEAAARTSDLKKGLEALLTAENLNGLSPVFTSLGLLRDEKGKTVVRTDGGPLAEVLTRCEERSNYGETASGRYLADEFSKEPFGWDFEAVRLFVLCLLRAGKLDATSKGQTIDSATSIDAKDTFSNNNLFRQASFRPKKGIEFQELVKAADAFRDTFGAEIKDLSNAKVVAEEIRKGVSAQEDAVVNSLATLTAARLPGKAVLEDALGQVRAIIRGTDDNAIAIFNASHRAIKDGTKRAVELEQSLSEPRLHDLHQAREVLATYWPFLEQEPDLAEDFRGRAASLKELLSRETFFRELATIDQNTNSLKKEYERRYLEALQNRVECYEKALKQLLSTPGFEDLDQEQSEKATVQLKRGTENDKHEVPIAQLRSEREACDARLRTAVAEVHRLLEGERVVMVSVSSYFSGGIETEEQLENALDGIRDECARLIGAGKKVLVQ